MMDALRNLLEYGVPLEVFHFLGIFFTIYLILRVFSSKSIPESDKFNRLPKFAMIYFSGYFLWLWLVTVTRLAHTLTPLSRSAVSNGSSKTSNTNGSTAADPQSVCPGYTATNIVENRVGGFTADLVLAGDACNVYGTDIPELSLLIEYQATDRLHVEIQPKYIGQNNQSWFVLPDVLVPKPESTLESVPASDLNFSYTNDPTFQFTVTRKTTGDVLFSTAGTVLVYEDQFIEFGSSLPESYNLYGLGETIRNIRLGNNLTRTMLNADVGDLVDKNLYGTHPIYLDTRYFEVDESGDLTYAPDATNKSAAYRSYTHGVFQRNAHAQEVVLQESSITWRALGGSIDLYFFEGPTQDKVTKAYQTSAIGLPAMQQYWTFGFHQCRWGYQNWTEVQGVIDSFAKNEIPLETMWNDIDYMKSYRNFENDPDRYPYDEGAEVLGQLHENNQHYIPIIDAGVYVPIPGNETDSYPPFDRGLEQGAFVLNPDDSVYIGEVWPGYCTWADWIGALFVGTGANSWWISEVAGFHKNLSFDGIWIDMNEVSSFCEGSCGSSDRNYGTQPIGNLELRALHEEDDDPRDINYPPYAINNEKGNLAGKTMSPNATHHDGSLEYDYHNLWGYQMINATYHALLEIFPEKRPFIITRSTFAGAGRQAGHWGGDNYSNWPYLYFSIPQALSFSLYGIPMFGVDTCGFSGNATEELCSRWMQLSAFFPFYRNHNTVDGASQEPYVWPSVAEAAKAAMKIRYALLPYIYTTHYLSHSTGSTTMRAMAWEFDDEPWLKDADRQFLLGSALLVTPVLQEGATTVDGVFPGAGSGTVWYDWYTQKVIEDVERGQNVTIEAPLGTIPLFVRGGHVVPMHESALTTTAVRNTPWSLLVALDGDGKASGGLYVDDGESLVPETSIWVDFTVEASKLSAEPDGTYDDDSNALGNVTVLGVQGDVKRVVFGETELDAGNWHLDVTSKVLSIGGLDTYTEDGAWKGAWSLTWSS
ncbi:family 31 glycosyl hydrolase [Xylariaceae sp. FL1272]|nr:family 31 glycosyl hydrolase [Xylariaceae sp. FL1272]